MKKRAKPKRKAVQVVRFLTACPQCGHFFRDWIYVDHLHATKRTMARLVSK